MNGFNNDKRVTRCDVTRLQIRQIPTNVDYLSGPATMKDGT
jgi:hypothetical protein